MSSSLERRWAWDLLERSALGSAGGYLLTRVISPRGLKVLAQEAFEQREWRRESRTDARDDSIRGNPERWLESAAGGKALDALFASSSVRAMLGRLTGLQWMPAGPKGAYSYYAAGHYLGLHRDVAECDLAVITCLHDHGGDRQSASGELRLYPARIADHLSDVRAAAIDEAVSIRLEPGDSLILLGGLIPHQVVTLGAGHERIVAPLCYRIL